jgi:hypothetical protein
MKKKLIVFGVSSFVSTVVISIFVLAFFNKQQEVSGTHKVSEDVLGNYDTWMSQGVFGKYQRVPFWSWFIATAQAAESGQAVISSDFRLQGPDGRMTAELTTSLEGTPSLFMYDHTGRVRLNLAIYPDGAPGIILNDESGQATAILRMATSQGQPVLIFKENGQDKMIIGLHPLSILSSTALSIGSSSFFSGFAMIGMLVMSFIVGGIGGMFSYQMMKKRDLEALSLKE